MLPLSTFALVIFRKIEKKTDRSTVSREKLILSVNKEALQNDTSNVQQER